MKIKLLVSVLLACKTVINGSDVATAECNIDVITITREIEKPIIVYPIGYVSFPDVHAVYKVFNEDTTWAEAEDRCVSEEGHLAIADSVAKIDHITSLRGNDKLIHVGIHRSNTTDEWVRVDNGLPVTSVPWQEDSPQGTGECVGISSVGEAVINYPCDRKIEWFACEIPVIEY